MNAVTTAGIIAAGEGSRFKKAGIPTHKPMLEVAGFPLIGHAIRNLEKAGVREVVIIFNETEGHCVDWVREHFKGLSFRFIVKSTASSFESFWLVGCALGPGRHLISTVDAFCLPEETRKMTEGAPPQGLALGLTDFVDDEKPLWVKFDETTGVISDLGGPAGKYATAGFYNVPGDIFKERPKGEIASLRVFLKFLVQSGVPTRGIVLSKVVDIDVPKDLKLAEALLKENHG